MPSVRFLGAAIQSRQSSSHQKAPVCFDRLCSGLADTGRSALERHMAEADLRLPLHQLLPTTQAVATCCRVYHLLDIAEGSSRASQ